MSASKTRSRLLFHHCARRMTNTVGGSQLTLSPMSRWLSATKTPTWPQAHSTWETSKLSVWAESRSLVSNLISRMARWVSSLTASSRSSSQLACTALTWPSTRWECNHKDNSMSQWKTSKPNGASKESFKPSMEKNTWTSRALISSHQPETWRCRHQESSPTRPSVSFY